MGKKTANKRGENKEKRKPRGLTKGANTATFLGGEAY